MKIIIIALTLALLSLFIPSCVTTDGFNFSGEISGELKDGTSVGLVIRPPSNSNK